MCYLSLSLSLHFPSIHSMHPSSFRNLAPLSLCHRPVHVFTSIHTVGNFSSLDSLSLSLSIFIPLTTLSSSIFGTSNLINTTENKRHCCMSGGGASRCACVGSSGWACVCVCGVRFSFFLLFFPFPFPFEGVCRSVYT